MSINTIKKALIGIQDLLIGTGTKAQTRNGTAYNIERLDLIKPIDTIVDLKALPVDNEDRMYSKVFLLGRLAIGDKLGGIYYWDATSEAISDDKFIVASTSIAIGRWLRVNNNPYRGATAQRFAALSVNNVSSTPVGMDTAGIDTDGIYEPAQPYQFKTPAGVTKVRFRGQVKWAANAVGRRTISISENGGTVSYLPFDSQDATVNIVGNTHTLVSPVMEVFPNRYYGMKAYQDSGDALDILSAWFEMEIVE